MMMGLVAAGIGRIFERSSSQAPDWRQAAEATTMPGRRAYTLALNNPDMVPASAARHMKDEDTVLGFFIHGQARAYPQWLTSNYHIINDTIGEEPVLITLCEVCGGAAAFRPVVPDLPQITLSFQICSVGLGTIEIMDFQTHSRWRPFLGYAFEGPLQGRWLDNYPLVVMTWKEWQRAYPETLVVNGSPQLRERPHGAESIGKENVELPHLFARTAHLSDRRLAPQEWVLGVRFPESGKPYALPISLLEPSPNLFRVKMGRKTILVARWGALAMIAFDLDATPYRNGFSLLPDAPLAFRSPDGKVWNAFGMSQGPEGREAKLPPARSYLTKWYEWVSHSPETELVSAIELLPNN
jgi:hypothetical protein